LTVRLSPQLLFVVFFSTITRPPGPTLFPYTTLFRSSREKPGYTDLPDLDEAIHQVVETGSTIGAQVLDTIGEALRTAGEALGGRSEEHTSELQSRFDLVCRLLLEKKKCSSNTPHNTT